MSVVMMKFGKKFKWHFAIKENKLVRPLWILARLDAKRMANIN